MMNAVEHLSDLWIPLNTIFTTLTQVECSENVKINIAILCSRNDSHCELLFASICFPDTVETISYHTST